MARVVLADENSLVLDLMRIFLSDEGHDLDLVSSPKGLLEQDLASLPSSAVLVLSDELDPGATSDLILEVRAQAKQPDLPCLLTMAPGGREAQHLPSTIGHVQMIRKPFDRGTFLSRVRSMTDRRQGQDDTHREREEPVPETNADVVSPESASPQEAPEPVASAMTREFELWFEERGAALVEMQIRSALERGGNGLIEKIAWQVVPELAETMIRDEIKRITRDMEDEAL